MAIERAPELEKLADQAQEAYRKGDFETLESMTSTDPAFMVVGTDATEVWEGSDQALEGLREEFASRGEEGGVESVTDQRRGFKAGEIGWVFTQGKFRLDDGTEIPTRGILIFQRENGDWKSVQSFFSIAVPNSALEAGSAMAEALSGATR